MSISTDMLISILTNLIGLAFVTEATVEILKNIFSITDDRIKFGISVIVGIVTSLATNFDLLGGNGVQYYAGILLAGILVSRGGNYLHEIVKILQSLSSANMAKAQHVNK